MGIVVCSLIIMGNAGFISSTVARRTKGSPSRLIGREHALLELLIFGALFGVAFVGVLRPLRDPLKPKPQTPNPKLGLFWRCFCWVYP